MNVAAEAQAQRSGEIASVATTAQRLASVERWQPITNAFSQVWAEEALEEARRCDTAAAGGEDAGPLHGVAVAVKDLFDVAGHETTGCCAAYEGNVATRDAELVARLRAAGAVILGKTNQHELAMGGTNQISACGPTHHPRDVARITGGSSGGSGAAIASGAVDVALGTDTGGSIRIPASFCGCWGLKPTHGALPVDGVMPLAPSLDCPGPMAAKASDLELLWRVLSSAGSGNAVPPAVPARVGVLGGAFARRVHPAERDAVSAVADVLASMGAELIPVDGEGAEDAAAVWVDVVCAEMVEAHRGLLDRRPELHVRTAGFFARGITLVEDRPEDLEGARRRAAEFRGWFERRFTESRVDLLIAPVTPYPAPLALETEVAVGDGETVDVHMGGTSIFTRPVNLAGNPALAVPAGSAGSGPFAGMPVACQLVAPLDGESVLLSAALALEGVGGRFDTQRPAPP